MHKKLDFLVNLEGLRAFAVISVMMQHWLNACQTLQKTYRPQVLWAGGSTEDLPLLQNRHVGELSIFVCEEGGCQLPVTSVHKVK